MKSFAASNAYVSAVHDLIPGGAHTYAKGDDQYPAGMAPVIEGGTGCRVRDIDGNEYVEFGSGLRSNLLGHGFEPVLRAARRWLDDGVNFVRPHRIELEAAERLTDLIPSAEMVKFGLNGSDATTAAVRLARAYTGRDMVAVCRDQPFFSTDDWFIVTTPMSAGIPEATRRLTVQFSYNDLDDLAALFDMYPGQIAAVVMEAETGEPPAPGLFRWPAPPVRPPRGAARSRRDDHRVPLARARAPSSSTASSRTCARSARASPTGSRCRRWPAAGTSCGSADSSTTPTASSCCPRPPAPSPGRWPPCWPPSTPASRTGLPSGSTSIGGELRRGIEEVVADAGLSSYFQLRGRDCNLTYLARDDAGQPSQAFRTLVLQEFVDRGILAPSFVVCAAHDPAAIEQTVDAVAELMPVYRRALECGIDQVLRGRPVRPAIRARG